LIAWRDARRAHGEPGVP